MLFLVLDHAEGLVVSELNMFSLEFVHCQILLYILTEFLKFIAFELQSLVHSFYLLKFRMQALFILTALGCTLAIHIRIL